MIRDFGIAALTAVALLAASSAARAQSGSEQCSTEPQAQTVISSSSNSGLVTAVAQSVPSDPVNCVPSYCAAARDESDDTKVAVGAGLSEAYARLVGEKNDDAALNLLSSACSSSCDEVIVTAFAASQATTASRLCEASLGGPGGSREASVVQVDAVSGSGGQAASGN